MLPGNCSLTPFPSLDALRVTHHPTLLELLKGTKQREILLQGRSLSPHNCPIFCPEVLLGQGCVWFLSPSQALLEDNKTISRGRKGPSTSPRLCGQKGEGKHSLLPGKAQGQQEQRQIHFSPPTVPQSCPKSQQGSHFSQAQTLQGSSSQRNQFLFPVSLKTEGLIPPFPDCPVWSHSYWEHWAGAAAI